ncbi:outer membrane protein assembly factor BamE [Candidatus Omnitrophota bacterium]
MKLHNYIICGLLALFLAGGGCAGIEPPTPDEVLRHPLGTDTIKVGMTKNQVREIWGEPDEVNDIDNDKRWKGPREEWVYRGQYSAIPFDAGYLSKTKHLYFDGNNLTNIAAK